jgi:hypothetical protein
MSSTRRELQLLRTTNMAPAVTNGGLRADDSAHLPPARSTRKRRRELNSLEQTDVRNAKTAGTAVESVTVEEIGSISQISACACIQSKGSLCTCVYSSSQEEQYQDASYQVVEKDDVDDDDDSAWYSSGPSSPIQETFDYQLEASSLAHMSTDPNPLFSSYLTSFDTPPYSSKRNLVLPDTMHLSLGFEDSDTITAPIFPDAWDELCDPIQIWRYPQRNKLRLA